MDRRRQPPGGNSQRRSDALNSTLLLLTVTLSASSPFNADPFVFPRPETDLILVVCGLAFWSFFGSSFISSSRPTTVPAHTYITSDAVLAAEQADYKRLYLDLLANQRSSAADNAGTIGGTFGGFSDVKPPSASGPAKEANKQAAATTSAREVGAAKALAASSAAAAADAAVVISELEGKLGAERLKSRQLVEALYSAQKAKEKSSLFGGLGGLPELPALPPLENGDGADGPGVLAGDGGDDGADDDGGGGFLSSLADRVESFFSAGDEERGDDDDDEAQNRRVAENAAADTGDGGAATAAAARGAFKLEEEGGDEEKDEEGEEEAETAAAAESLSSPWSWFNQVKDATSAAVKEALSELQGSAEVASATLGSTSLDSDQQLARLSVKRSQAATQNTGQESDAGTPATNGQGASEDTPETLLKRAALVEEIEVGGQVAGVSASSGSPTPLVGSASESATAANTGTLSQVSTPASPFPPSLSSPPPLPLPATLPPPLPPPPLSSLRGSGNPPAQEEAATTTTTTIALAPQTSLSNSKRSPSSPWPSYGAEGHATQQVIDALVYDWVGYTREVVDSTPTSSGSIGSSTDPISPYACFRSLEACRLEKAKGAVLSAPPLHLLRPPTATDKALQAPTHQWRVCLMPKTERGGVRAFMLLEQGLKRHPNVTWVECSNNPDNGGMKSADLVVWMPGGTKLPPHRSLVPPRKLVVMDFGDGFQPLPIASNPKDYGLYFKRSWVTRRYQGPDKPRSVSVPHYAKKRAYFPTGYSVAEEFLLEAQPSTIVADVFEVERKRPVTCTLRPSGRGSYDVRKVVLGWVTEAVEEWGLRGSAVGEVDHGGRTTIQNKNYLQTMRESRIVVTANPTGWEGDSRTYEALASGALVMVDHMQAPMAHPLLDKVHVVYYDPMDKADFRAKLRHYLDHPSEARQIGLQGHVHASKYHRTVNRIDYMLNVALMHKEKLWEKRAGEEGGGGAGEKEARGHVSRRQRRRRGLMGGPELSSSSAASPPTNSSLASEATLLNAKGDIDLAKYFNKPKAA